MSHPPKSKHFPDAFYRVAVKGLLVRAGKVMMVEDIVHGPPVWELPGGGLDFGEDFRTALKREVEEEMGLKVTSVGEKPTYIWVGKRHNARGMEWYYVLVLAFRFEVENLDFTPTEECKSISFMSKEDLQNKRAGINDQMQPLIDIFNPADFT